MEAGATVGVGDHQWEWDLEADLAMVGAFTAITLQVDNFQRVSFFHMLSEIVDRLLGSANKDLWGLCAPISIIVVYSRTAISYFWGLRNNWYQCYDSTIIEIGAQRPQSGPIA